MGRIMKGGSMRRTLMIVISVAIVTTALLILPACVPTYPKAELSEGVKKVCKDEYDLDVDVVVRGSTMGIYYPMEGLMDPGMGISEKAWDDISSLILIASRVALSTDAEIKFYCVITQDARLPELQVVIIKYIEDVKRGMYRMISRNESFKRTLFTINLTPQAKKERSVEKIFDKLGVESQTREKVMDEFFRSPPSKLSDIGYWKEVFYLKDVSLSEFIAAQIANRVKIDFRGDKELVKMFDYKASEGLYSETSDKGSFLVKFKIFDQVESGEAAELRIKKIEEIVRIGNEVIQGYKFNDFDFLILEDQLENVRLKVNMQDVCDFKINKVSIKDIVQAPSGYFGSE